MSEIQVTPKINIEVIPFFNMVDMSNKELVEALTKMLIRLIDEQLTKRQKQVMKLYLFEEKKQCEIASILNLSQPTVSRTYSVAMDKLQRYMFYCNRSIESYIKAVAKNEQTV